MNTRNRGILFKKTHKPACRRLFASAVALAICTIGASSLSAAVLVGYEVLGRTGSSPAFVTPNTQAANTTGSNLTQGAGLTNAGANNQFLARSFTTGDLAASVTANDYFALSITPSSGYQVSLSTLVLNLRLSGSNSPTNFQVRYSFNNSSFTNVGPEVVEPTPTTGTSYLGTSISLNIAALQNVTSTVYLRFYGYESAFDSGDAFSAAGIINSTGDDFVVNGSVSAVPEPGTAGLITLAGGVLVIALRRRSRSRSGLREIFASPPRERKV